MASSTGRGAVKSPWTDSTSATPSGERLLATRSRDRTSSRTWWPWDTRAATEWEPTNPVPPVTSTLTGVLRAGPLALVQVMRLPAPAGSRTTGCHSHDILSYDSESIYS